MERFFLSVILSWFLILQPFVWIPAIQAASNTAGQEIMLFYANDVRGETDPCG